MPFPDFDFCLICDGVRPEVGGKLTILGFFGLAPNVEIVVSNPAAPVTVGMVAGFPPVAGVETVYQHSIVIGRPDRTPLQQTPPSTLNTSPTGRGVVVFGFIIPPPIIFGTYSIRILVNGEPKLDKSIRVRQATAAELAHLGIAPPVAGGRPH